jgi:hypothetical protein
MSLGYLLKIMKKATLGYNVAFGVITLVVVFCGIKFYFDNSSPFAIAQAARTFFSFAVNAL